MVTSKEHEKEEFLRICELKDTYLDSKSNSLLTLNFRFVDCEYLLAMISRFITPWHFLTGYVKIRRCLSGNRSNLARFLNAKYLDSISTVTFARAKDMVFINRQQSSQLCFAMLAFMKRCMKRFFK